jgi:hypothetical protein
VYIKLLVAEVKSTWNYSSKEEEMEEEVILVLVCRIHARKEWGNETNERRQERWSTTQPT